MLRRIPLSIRQRIKRLYYRFFRMESRFHGRSRAEIFDEIYEKGLWGLDDLGVGSSGSGSHDSAIVEPYVGVVRQLIEELEISSLVDLGCGDMSVGEALLPYVAQYSACDVSKVVIARNKARVQAENLRFDILDIAEDPLPIADIGMVRQVLQHLSNRDIEAFVRRLNGSESFQYLLVTEAKPLDPNMIPNVDKPTGQKTRVGLNSAVVLDAPPFNLKFRSRKVMLSVPESVGSTPAAIETVLYAL